MPSQKKYPVTLAAEDREALERVTRTGVHPASVIRRARLLLALDTAVGEVEDRVVIAEQAGVSCETVRLVSSEHSDDSDHLVRGFRTGVVGGRVAADAWGLVPRCSPPCGCWS